MIIFIGGTGPRAGSFLFDYFHASLEKHLGRTPFDHEFPNTVLISLPQKETSAFSGDFDVDFRLLKAIVEGIKRECQEDVVIVPLCVTLSPDFEREFPGSLTIGSFIKENFPGVKAYCSKKTKQERILGEREYLDSTAIIEKYYESKGKVALNGVLACTELSLIEVEGAIDAPRMFVEDLAVRFYENRC